MNKGWFIVDGLQDGDRRVEEQMQGLDGLLEHAAGSTVLDLGCAEGLIAIKFAVSGASKVDGLDNNRTFVRQAKAHARTAKDIGACAVRFEYADLNAEWPAWADGRYDIVLALAILHKLQDVEPGVRRAAKATHDRLVVRLPYGSLGVLRAKHFRRNVCDLRLVLPDEGLQLVKQIPGPRGEWVQHWRRT